MTTRTDKEILQDIKDGKLTDQESLEFRLMHFMDFLKFDVKTREYVFTAKAKRLLK